LAVNAVCSTISLIATSRGSRPEIPLRPAPRSPGAPPHPGSLRARAGHRVATKSWSEMILGSRDSSSIIGAMRANPKMYCIFLRQHYTTFKSAQVINKSVQKQFLHAAAAALREACFSPLPFPFCKLQAGVPQDLRLVPTQPTSVRYIARTQPSTHPRTHHPRLLSPCGPVRGTS